jgi:hypothetical protein
MPELGRRRSLSMRYLAGKVSMYSEFDETKMERSEGVARSPQEVLEISEDPGHSTIEVEMRRWSR